MKVRSCCFLCLLAVACAQKAEPASSAPAASAPAASVAPAVTAPPLASSLASSAPPLASSAPTPAAESAYLACRATVNDAEVVTADVMPHPAKGMLQATVTIRAKGTTRKLLTTAVPHAGTYTLVFESYSEGDTKPAAEKLIKGKTPIVRLVTIGDRQELYAESDFFGKGADASGHICVK